MVSSLPLEEQTHQRLISFTPSSPVRPVLSYEKYEYFLYPLLFFLFMKVSIDSIIFMDCDNTVFTEGVDEYLDKYRRGETIDPIEYLFEKDGFYYAGHGRHRTFMFYHRLNMRSIDAVKSEIPLGPEHKYALQNGCVTIRDLHEENLCDED